MRLGDPLPPDPRHREVFAIAASTGVVVTASLADANLRIWQPLSNFFLWYRWGPPRSG